MNIKAIIFDWGRTLYDVDLNAPVSGAEDVLSYCKQKGYTLCVSSLARPLTGSTVEGRKLQIQNSPLSKYIDMFEVSDAKEKDEIMDKMVDALRAPREEILVVDDRVVKSIKYGNTHGHPTAWFQTGKFKDELPNEDTGAPTYTIHTLSELKTII